LKLIISKKRNHSQKLPRKKWYNFLKIMERIDDPYQLLHINILSEARLKQINCDFVQIKMDK